MRDDCVLEISDACFEWRRREMTESAATAFRLSGINMTIRRGQLIGVIGKVHLK